MARLNLVPSSATKLRMLSLGANETSDDAARPMAPRANAPKASGSGNIRIGQIPLGRDSGTFSTLVGGIDDITNRLNKDTTTMSTPSRRNRYTSPKILEPIPSPDFKSQLEDIESIDLTGDVEQSTSSGAVEVFGESQTIWREDYAMRPEPVSKPNRKR